MRKALIIVVLLVILLPAGLVLADIAFENTKVTTHTFPGPIDEIVVRSGGGDVELVPARGRGGRCARRATTCSRSRRSSATSRTAC